MLLFCPRWKSPRPINITVWVSTSRSHTKLQTSQRTLGCHHIAPCVFTAGSQGWPITALLSWRGLTSAAAAGLERVLVSSKVCSKSAVQVCDCTERSLLAAVVVVVVQGALVAGCRCGTGSWGCCGTGELGIFTLPTKRGHLRNIFQSKQPHNTLMILFSQQDTKLYWNILF